MSKSTPSGIPGVDMMSDTLDFFKNMWGSVPGMNMPGMNIPGMVMPTLSVEEIDKQIKDLKAVESWLALNMSMLQGTIQALEVQRTTISTLQSMGETLSAAMQPPARPETTEKQAFQSPFGAMASQPPAAAQQSAAPEKPAQEKPAVHEKPEKPAASDAPSATAQSAGTTPGVPPLANPAVWWNMLQDQFKQAVDTAAAMTPDPAVAAATAAAATGAAKPAPAKSAAAKPKTAAQTASETGAKTAAKTAPKKRKPAPKE